MVREGMMAHVFLLEGSTSMKLSVIITLPKLMHMARFSNGLVSGTEFDEIKAVTDRDQDGVS